MIHPSILTVSGNYFDFLKPETSEFTIEDIAHALSLLCRYNGHCREFYSVAQHSVLVSHIVPEEFALQALLHDAAEAFMGDIPTPLKMLLPDFKEIENNVERVVLECFGVDSNLAPEVKQADLVALATEVKHLLPEHEGWEILKDVEPVSDRVFQPLNSETAKWVFLRRYEYLTW